MKRERKKAGLPPAEAAFFREVFLLREELSTATADDVDQAASRLEGQFPRGYEEYVTRLGRGRLYETFDVFLPSDVLHYRRVYRLFWNNIQDSLEDLPKALAKLGGRAVPLGETVFGQYFVFDPAAPDTVYLAGAKGLEPFGDSLVAAIREYINRWGNTEVLDFLPAGFEWEEVMFDPTTDTEIDAVFDACCKLKLHDAVSRGNRPYPLYIKSVAGAVCFEDGRVVRLAYARNQSKAPAVRKVRKCLARLGYEQRQEHEAIDFEQLRDAVRKAARRAFTLMRKKHPGEKFYAYALCTTVDAATPFPAANSEEGLQRRAEKYAADEGDSVDHWMHELRWLPGDWEFAEGAEFFEAVDALVQAGQEEYGEDEAQFEKLRRRFFQAYLEALQDLDRDGFFGQGKDRERITVLLEESDPVDEDLMLRWAHALNPPAAYERYAERFDQDEE